MSEPGNGDLIPPENAGRGARGNGAPMKTLHFSPTIELGHVIQAVVTLVMIGGWAIVGYQNITKQIDGQSAQLELVKAKLASDEIQQNDLRDTQRAAIAETRQALGKISDQISDLGAKIAARGDGRR